MPEIIENKLRIIYEWLNDRTYGIIRILRIAVFNYGESNATQSAAGMAYYAFFSLFPLLLLTYHTFSNHFSKLSISF